LAHPCDGIEQSLYLADSEDLSNENLIWEPRRRFNIRHLSSFNSCCTLSHFLISLFTSES